MTHEVVLGNQIIVVEPNGHVHIADISNIMTHVVDRESVRPALAAYFEKHGLRMATVEEAERSGFPTRKEHKTIPHRLLPRLQRVR